MSISTIQSQQLTLGEQPAMRDLFDTKARVRELDRSAFLGRITASGGPPFCDDSSDICLFHSFDDTLGHGIGVGDHDGAKALHVSAKHHHAILTM
jgi:hypothetical protein